LKPGISFPTGNEEKGLGAGQLGGHLFLIASQELGSWAFHGNLGYIRNENHADERKDIWHASIAATWEVIKNLKLAANIGIERNPDEDADNDPAFLIGGVIYSIKENLDVDLGVKCGLTKSETDISALAGVTFRF
jgi:long-subunit fatty acid transport protein